MNNQFYSSFKHPQRCEIYYIWCEVVPDINYPLAKKVLSDRACINCTAYTGGLEFTWQCGTGKIIITSSSSSLSCSRG